MLLAVLIMISVLFLFGWSEAQFAITHRRQELHAARARSLEQAIQYALARLESDVREAVRASPALRRGQLFKPYFDSVSVPSSEIAVRVSGTVDPVFDHTLVQTVARDPGSGHPMSVVRSATYLLDVDGADLHEVVSAATRESGRPEVIGEWLFDVLRQLRETEDAHPWSRLDDAILRRASLEGMDRGAVDSVLLHLNPHPRLRRTNSHPQRMGQDRARISAPGTVIATGTSGRVRLRVTAWLESRPDRVIQRSVLRTLLERRRLQTQSDWLASNAVWGGGVRLGPELVDDADVAVGSMAGVVSGVDSAAVQWTRYGGLLREETTRRWLARGRALDVGTDSPRAPTESDASWTLRALGSGAWVEWGERSLSFSRGGVARTTERIAEVGVLSATVVAVGVSGRVEWFTFNGDVAHAPLQLEGVARASFSVPLYDTLVIATTAGWFAARGDGSVTALAGAPVSSEVTSVVNGRSCGWTLIGGRAVARYELRPPDLHVTVTRLDDARPSLTQCVVIGGRPLGRHVDGSLSAWTLLGDRIVERLVERPAEFGAAGFMIAQEPPGVWSVDQWLRWFPVEPLVGKRPALDGHLALVPRGMAGPTAFVARCDGTLKAEVVTSAGGTEIMDAAGTLAAESSVLGGGDLSDLFIDGAFSSPIRAETLRYSTLEQGLDVPLSTEQGWLSVLLKPERDSATSTEPSRIRTVVRLEQWTAIEFQPTAQWISDHHPAQPSVSAIAAFTVSGGVRPVRLRCELQRRPNTDAWVHMRSTIVTGQPWTVAVATGDPLQWLDPWVIDSVDPWIPDEHVFVSDDTNSGRWHWLSLQWDEASTGIAFDDRQQSEARTTTSVFVLASPSDRWVLEFGGAIGDKAFGGTARDFRLSSGEPPPFDWAWLEPSGTTDGAHFSWPVDVGGTHLRSVYALGAFPSGATIDWTLRAVDDTEIATVRRSGRLLSGRDLPSAERFVVAGRLVFGRSSLERSGASASSAAGTASWPLLEALVAEFLVPPLGRRRSRGAYETTRTR